MVRVVQEHRDGIPRLPTARAWIRVREGDEVGVRWRPSSGISGTARGLDGRRNLTRSDSGEVRQVDPVRDQPCRTVVESSNAARATLLLARRLAMPRRQGAAAHPATDDVLQPATLHRGELLEGRALVLCSAIVAGPLLPISGTPAAHKHAVPWFQLGGRLLLFPGLTQSGAGLAARRSSGQRRVKLTSGAEVYRLALGLDAVEDLLVRPYEHVTPS